MRALGPVEQAYERYAVGALGDRELEEIRTGPEKESRMLWIIKSGKTLPQIGVLYDAG